MIIDVWHAIQSFTIPVISRGDTCGTAFSEPLSSSVIEDGYLWWPLGVRWSLTKEVPKMTEVTAKVTVSMGAVSLCK